MKTKIQNLENAIFNANGAVCTTLKHILDGDSMLRTGHSGYSKGWASKSVWTMKVCMALDSAKIKYVYGNDAPRGGANGEYVQITDKVLLKQIEARMKPIREDIAAKQAEEEKVKEERNQRIAGYVAMVDKIEDEAWEQTCSRLSAAIGAHIDSGEFHKAVKMIRKK